MSSTIAPHVGEAVPFLDLITPHRALEEEFVGALRRALQSAAFIGGPEVTAFEQEFARFCTTPDAVGVNSGTDALRFAFMALGLQGGDEVITVAHTFMATSEAITQAGGVVQFVDVTNDTLTMDPAHLESAINSRTVGIVPVHLYGQSADMDPILRIAEKHGLWVVEDACQAHGATYKGLVAGSMGAMGAFSFYPGKNLGACGEGGAIVGKNAVAMNRVRQLREHGQVRKYYHDSEGYNGRLDAIQAAFLRIKLRHLAEWNAQRREAAGLYRDALSDISEIELPVEAEFAQHVYHLYVIRTERRDALQEHLQRLNIGTGLHYPLPLHLQKAYAHRGWKRGFLPTTEAAADSILSLPMFPGLKPAHVERVADAIRGFFHS
ncbi:MAG: DegT/DnrJ/EryC1/StrS family aminotransferase [Gemmatimonadaceae bacterium]